MVLAVSVDDWEKPRFAQVHMIDGAEMMRRFDRAYEARLKAGHSIPVGQGVWVPLYIPDDSNPSHAGGGAGLAYPALKRVPLNDEGRQSTPQATVVAVQNEENGRSRPQVIQDWKQQLASSLGIDPSNIKITIEA